MATVGYYSPPVPLCRGPSSQASLAASRRAAACRGKWHQTRTALQSRGGDLLRFPTKGPVPARVFHPPLAHNERSSQRGAQAAPAHPAPGPGPRSPGDPGLSPRHSSLETVRRAGTGGSGAPTPETDFPGSNSTGGSQKFCPSNATRGREPEGFSPVPFSRGEHKPFHRGRKNPRSGFPRIPPQTPRSPGETGPGAGAGAQRTQGCRQGSPRQPRIVPGHQHGPQWRSLCTACPLFRGYSPQSGEPSENEAGGSEPALKARQTKRTPGRPGSLPLLRGATQLRGAALRTRGWPDEPPAEAPLNGLKSVPPAQPLQAGAQGGGLRSARPLSYGFPSP
ncbi:basic salivary proline-rich protein 3-like [Lathamus discolor]|uniref:basic salivary proline-rich protein 3-like n=1 Tax=Lathamus discolor TaxID=678569 RepID=UPI0032B84E64